MKFKKNITFLVAISMMFTMLFANVSTVSAATGNKTVNSSGTMSVILSKGQTKDSSVVSFNVSGLPANAKITKIEINTGSLTYSGAVVTNYLTLTSGSTTEKIAWNGSANTKLTANLFKVKPANGTYMISFNSTCVGGALINGVMTNTGTKSYKRPSITVYWDDTL